MCNEMAAVVVVPKRTRVCAVFLLMHGGLHFAARQTPTELWCETDDAIVGGVMGNPDVGATAPHHGAQWQHPRYNTHAHLSWPSCRR